MSLVKSQPPSEPQAEAPADGAPADPSYGENRAASEAARFGAPPAARPDYVPEKFWKDGKVDLETAFKSYGELETRFNTKTEDMMRQLDADRRKGLPETPDKYEIKIEDPPIPLDQLQAHPAFDWWRKAAHDAGIPQEKFSEGVTQLVGILTQGPDLEAEAKKLGENAQARIDAVGQWARSTFTDPTEFEAIQMLGTSAAGIKVLERLMGGGAAQPSTIEPTAPALTIEKVKSMMNDPRYYDRNKRDLAFIKEVDEAFARLYPSKGK